MELQVANTLQEAINDARNIIFDFDGVLANSEELQFTVWMQLLEEKGLSTDLTVAELAGVDDLIIAENLFSALALNSYVKIVEEKVALYESRLDRNSPYPGAAELIDSLLSEEKNISICSGSPRKYIVPFVREYYNLDSFTKIIGSEDYIEHKPSPEPYLIALEDSNFDPSCTIVIEDSIDGCTAATEANLTVIHLDAYYINSKIPDYRVRSLNEITAAIGTEVEGIIS